MNLCTSALPRHRVMTNVADASSGSHWRPWSVVKFPVTYWRKLSNVDWLRERAFFLNPKSAFVNQEGHDILILIG